MGEDVGGGVGTSEGRGSAVGVGRRRIGGGLGEKRVVTLVDGVIEAESGESVGQPLVLLDLGRGIEPESQFDASLELVDVLVGYALAAPVLPIAFAPEPGLVALRIRRPRFLLVQRRHRRRIPNPRGEGGRRVGFRHGWESGRSRAQPRWIGVVRRSRDLARWVRERYGFIRFLVLLLNPRGFRPLRDWGGDVLAHFPHASLSLSLSPLFLLSLLLSSLFLITHI